MYLVINASLKDGGLRNSWGFQLFLHSVACLHGIPCKVASLRKKKKEKDYVLQIALCLGSSCFSLSTFMSINTSYPCFFVMNFKLTNTMNIHLNLVNNVWCNLPVKLWRAVWNQWEDSHSAILFGENQIETLAMFKAFTEFKFPLQYYIHNIDGSKPDRQSWVRIKMSYWCIHLLRL